MSEKNYRLTAHYAFLTLVYIIQVFRWDLYI